MKKAMGKQWNKADSYKWQEHLAELNKKSEQTKYYKADSPKERKPKERKPFGEVVKKYVSRYVDAIVPALSNDKREGMYVDTRAHDAMTESIARARRYCM